jgi:hypothetical protein
MKKLTILFALAFGMNVNAQITVKEKTVKDSVIWKSLTAPLPKLVEFKGEEYQSLVFYFKNAEYTTLTDVEYFTLGDKETANEFFGLCLQSFEEKKKIELDLSGESITIQKGVGTIIITTRKGYFYLTKKQVENIIESIK